MCATFPACRSYMGARRVDRVGRPCHLFAVTALSRRVSGVLCSSCPPSRQVRCTSTMSQTIACIPTFARAPCAASPASTTALTPALTEIRLYIHPDSLHHHVEQEEGARRSGGDQEEVEDARAACRTLACSAGRHVRVEDELTYETNGT